MLDFQDAVMGPAAYDLASLAAGRARRRAGADWSSRCSAATCAARRAAPTRISTPPSSSRLYVTLAAQRASKILGIFARLDMRDGKPQYLRHMPRVWGYLRSARSAIRRWTRSMRGTTPTCRR